MTGSVPTFDLNQALLSDQVFDVVFDYYRARFKVAMLGSEPSKEETRSLYEKLLLKELRLDTEAIISNLGDKRRVDLSTKLHHLSELNTPVGFLADCFSDVLIHSTHAANYPFSRSARGPALERS